MTSASELFHGRRSRLSRNNTDLGFDSAPERTLHYYRRHHNHHHHRHDADDCHPIRRSPPLRHPCHRLPQTERESAQLGHGTRQSVIGNSINRETSSSRTNRCRFPQGDRLPGAVLQARERLLQRLRGVSISGDRQSSRESPDISLEFVDSDHFRFIDVGDWETENSVEWVAEGASFGDSTSQADWISSLPNLSKKPPALSEEAIELLHGECFSDIEIGDEGSISRATHECSICLETFLKGDGLIHLPCGHRFHSTCLEPWVKTCGDCPYCRAVIDFDYHRAGEKIMKS